MSFFNMPLCSLKEKTMKKILMVLMLIGLGAVVATAGSGVGIYGSYFNADDPGPGFGGGIKFKTDLSEYFGVEARASCITQFDEDDTDDGVYLIPLEAGLLFNLPLQDSPLNLYGGGGIGYAIIPEADDVDLDDEICFYAVAGVEFSLSDSASLFAEAQYRVLEVDGAEVDDYGEVDLDDEKVDFSGFGINAGLLFRF
jgi:opacity protein-like surface antigen